MTCVFLNHMDSVTDPVLSAFSYGILELTTVFRHIIQMASVYEEVRIPLLYLSLKPTLCYIFFFRINVLKRLGGKQRDSITL